MIARSLPMLTAGAVVAGSLVAGSVAAAEEFTVVIAAAKDAMIFGLPNGTDTGNASGRGPAMFAGADGGLRAKRAMVAFDLASAPLPPNAQITSVTLTMFVGMIAGSGGGGGGGAYPTRTLRVYRLQQDWAEGKSGDPTSPNVGGTGQGFPRLLGDSSWSYAVYDARPWTLGGDISSTEIGSATFGEPFLLNQAYSWSSPGMRADVVSWFTGTAPNNGWLIKSDLETSPTSFLGFWTKDGAAANDNPALAPQLTITYSIPRPPGQPPTRP